MTGAMVSRAAQPPFKNRNRVHKATNELFTFCGLCRKHKRRSTCFLECHLRKGSYRCQTCNSRSVSELSKLASRCRAALNRKDDVEECLKLYEQQSAIEDGRGSHLPRPLAELTIVKFDRKRPASVANSVLIARTLKGVVKQIHQSRVPSKVMWAKFGMLPEVIARIQKGLDEVGSLEKITHPPQMHLGLAGLQITITVSDFEKALRGL